jgi:hypothetical protein
MPDSKVEKVLKAYNDLSLAERGQFAEAAGILKVEIYPSEDQFLSVHDRPEWIDHPPLEGEHVFVSEIVDDVGSIRVAYDRAKHIRFIEDYWLAEDYLQSLPGEIRAVTSWTRGPNFDSQKISTRVYFGEGEHLGDGERVVLLSELADWIRKTSVSSDGTGVDAILQKTIDAIPADNAYARCLAVKMAGASREWQRELTCVMAGHTHLSAELEKYIREPLPHLSKRQPGRPTVGASTDEQVVEMALRRYDLAVYLTKEFGEYETWRGNKGADYNWKERAKIGPLATQFLNEVPNYSEVSQRILDEVLDYIEDLYQQEQRGVVRKGGASLRDERSPKWVCAYIVKRELGCDKSVGSLVKLFTVPESPREKP